eukprot:m.471286 g.471286  ORF g.471286 m.471286 type:complete len:66 (+) comp20375_c1_seq1:110-307(+)
MAVCRESAVVFAASQHWCPVLLTWLLTGRYYDSAKFSRQTDRQPGFLGIVHGSFLSHEHNDPGLN